MYTQMKECFRLDKTKYLWQNLMDNILKRDKISQKNMNSWIPVVTNEFIESKLLWFFYRIMIDFQVIIFTFF